MDEQTSLTNFEDIFSDITDADIAEMTESDTTIEDEAQSEEATTTDAEVKTEPAEQKYKLKHLGEEKEVTLEEMTSLSQKGMDYDRIRGKYDELNNRLRELAGNESVDDFLNNLGTRSQEQAIQKRIDELIVTGDYSEAGARAQAELELKLKGQEVGLKQQREFEARSKSIGEFAMNNAEFRTAFPDGIIDKGILDDLNNGKSIGEAWTSYQLARERSGRAELEQRLQKLEQELKNKESAAPSVSTKTSTETDPFLQGLFGS